MAAFRVVRDRTREGEVAFEVIQASKIILIVVVREADLPSSPAFRWRVAFDFGSRKSAVIGIAATVQEAFEEAITSLREKTPRGRLPSFTKGEWSSIRDELGRHGIFETGG